MPHSFQPNQHWDYFAVHTLLAPTIVLVGIIIIFFPLSVLFNSWKLFETGFVTQYIGSRYFKPFNPRLYSSLKIVQFCCSLSSVVLWVICTYHRYRVALILEVLVTPVFIVAYGIEMVKFQLHPASVLSPANLVDVYTIVPTFANLATGKYDEKQWVSLLFLRVYTVVDAFHDIESSGFRLPLSTFGREVVLLTLRTTALVVVLAGTIFTCEILGEIPFLHSDSIDTTMGELNFVQMIYWIFTTISTVGYGDFSPTTVCSRLFTIVFIVVGVVFFGVETGKLTKLQALERDGMGSYQPTPKRKHVVICGGGVKTCGQVLFSLLDELYSSEEEGRWPNAVMMSVSGYPDNLRNHVNVHVPPHINRHLIYLVGSPMLRDDCNRAGMGLAATVYVIPDVSATGVYEEDGQNFLRALSIRKFYPAVNLRLMTLKEDTRRWALNAGVPDAYCFSMQSLKVKCLAHSVYCHGFITFVSNLVESDDVPIDEMGKQLWKTEYSNGSNNTMYGVCVPEKYSGCTWQEFTVRFFEDTGAIAFGGQINGDVVLNPSQSSSEKLKGGEVVFIISYDLKDVSEGLTDEWINRFNCAKTQFLEHITGGDGHIKHQGTHLKKASLSNDNAAPGISEIGLQRRRSWPRFVEDLSDSNDHIVVVACSLRSSNWVQIQLVVEALLQGREHEVRPIVVLASSSPPAEMIREFDDVLFVKRAGEVLSPLDLEAAQLHTASDIVLLSDEVPENNRDAFKDQDTVMVASALDAYLSMSKKKVNILHDFLNPESVNFLPEVGVEDRRTTDFDQMHTDRDTTSVQRTWKKHLGLWKESLRLQPRFAMGQLFTLNFVGAMMGREYYVPSTMEVLLTLVTCHGQHSIPLLVPLPQIFHGKQYGELVKAWLGDIDVAIPMGVRRQLYPDAAGGQDKSLGYVITNPISTFKLQAPDYIYVLATPSFGVRIVEEAEITTDRGGATELVINAPEEPRPDADDLIKQAIDVAKTRPQELERAIAKLQEALVHLGNARTQPNEVNF